MDDPSSRKLQSLTFMLCLCLFVSSMRQCRWMMHQRKTSTNQSGCEVLQARQLVDELIRPRQGLASTPVAVRLSLLLDRLQGLASTPVAVRLSLRQVLRRSSTNSSQLLEAIADIHVDSGRPLPTNETTTRGTNPEFLWRFRKLASPSRPLTRDDTSTRGLHRRSP